MARNDEINIDDIDDNDPDAGSQLRRYAKQQAERAKALPELERRLAFAEAGIDTSTRQGQAFAATFDGDISDRDAILADAKEFNPAIIRGAVPVADAGSTTQPGETPVTAPEPTGTSERTALADGALPSGAAIPDVKTQALDSSRDALKKGAPQGVAMGSFIAEIARGTAEGNLAPLDRTGTRA